MSEDTRDFPFLKWGNMMGGWENTRNLMGGHPEYTYAGKKPLPTTAYPEPDGWTPGTW